MNVFEVISPTLDKQFYHLPNQIYSGNDHFTPALGSDLDQVFNQEKNSLFKNGDLKRWVAYDEWNHLSGRIAAFYSYHHDGVKGGIGFFETTDDYKVSQSLFQVATSWLKQHHCDQAEFPVNFGEKDRYWGLLTSGFDLPCIYLENYNPPYYEAHLLKYGFAQKDIINTYKVALEQIPHQRLKSLTERLITRHQIEFIPFSFHDKERFSKDIHQVYISSFKKDNRLQFITVDSILHLLEMAKPVLEDELIWIAYHKDIPVGFLAFMKDLNQIMNNKNDDVSLKGFAVAVSPDQRKIGIELGLSYSLFQSLIQKKKKYSLYFTGIHVKTGAMISFMKKLNAIVIKQHTTFEINL